MQLVRLSLKGSAGGGEVSCRPDLVSESTLGSYADGAFFFATDPCRSGFCCAQLPANGLKSGDTDLFF